MTGIGGKRIRIWERVSLLLLVPDSMQRVANRAPPLPFALRRSQDVSHREAVVPLYADSLKDGRDDIAVRCHHLIQLAYTDHTGVVALGVYHSTVANNVVYDDQRARPRHLQPPVEVDRIARLVRIDED